MLEYGSQESVGEGKGIMETREKEVLTADEAAEFLGFNPVTVRLKARSGEIPGRKIGKEWRFSRRVLLEWLEEGSRPKAAV
ncbi:MAG: helix-turn-helix domain-containing protein [Rubrobacter sp.]